MVWFYVDDGLAFHQKAIEAGNSAMGLWVRAGAWSTGNLTDGYIPLKIARKLGTKRDADRLKSVGLWYEKLSENCQKLDGYRFHDWDHRQLTKVEVEQKRKADRARKAEQRKVRNVPLGQPLDVPPDTERNPSGVTSENPEDSSRALPRACAPHPTPPHIGVEAYGSNSREAPNPEPPPPLGVSGEPPPCPDHPHWEHDQPCRKCAAIRKWDQDSDSRRAAHNRETASLRHVAIDACPHCDHNGMRDIGSAVIRCDHTDPEEPW